MAAESHQKAKRLHPQLEGNGVCCVLFMSAVSLGNLLNLVSAKIAAENILSVQHN